jgi:hypothetical protein
MKNEECPDEKGWDVIKKICWGDDCTPYDAEN